MWADEYEKIVSADDLEVGKHYLIVYEWTTESKAYVMAGMSSGYMGNVEATIADGKISLPTGANVITLGGNSSGYTLYLSQSNNYLYYSGSGTGLGTNSSVDNKTKWTITFDNGSAKICNVGKSDRYVRNYTSNHTFRGYTTSNGEWVSLYKEVEASSATPSITAHDVNITYDATSGTIDYTINNEPDPAGTLTAAIADGGTIADLSIGTITGTTVPFTCSANTSRSSRTATVTLTYTYGDNQTATKNVTLTQAGNPNVFNNISEIVAVGTDYAVKGTVVATNARGFVIGDGTGYIYTYLNAAPTQSVGDMVSISGTTGSYGHIIQFTKTATIETATSSNYDNTPAIAVLDADGMAAYNSDYKKSDYVQLEGTLAKDNNNYEITVGTSKARISYPNDDQTTALDALLDKEVCVKGYFAGFNSTTFTIMLESVEEIVRNAYTLTVNVSNGSVEITGKTLTDGSCEISEGASVTATATPAEHYTFTSWTATGVTLTDGTANPLVFTMPSNAVTLTANFTEKAKHTVTFYANGSEIGTDADVYEGDAITFPAVTAPESYTFMGWTADEMAAPQNNAPADLLTTATMGNADVTYYAVFAVVSGNIKTATLTASHTKNNTTYADHTYTDDKGNEWSGNTNEPYENSVARIGLRNTSGSYLESPTFSGNVTDIKIMTFNGSGSERLFNIKSTKDGDADLGTVAAPANTKLTEEQTATLTGTSFNKFFIIPSGAVGFSYIKVTYGNQSVSGYCTTIPTTGTIALNAACTDGTMVYGTYSDSRAFIVPADLIVAEVGVVDGELLVDEYDTGDVVPANTGVLVSAADDTPVTITYSGEAGTSVLGSDNCLRATGAGMTAAEMSAADSNCLFYRLTMHNGKTIGFWWGAEEGASFAIAANKAYLAVPQSTGNAGSRQGFRIGGNVTTAISGVAERENADATVYNLQGQRVQGGVKGIVIQNGKKFINK